MVQWCSRLTTRGDHQQDHLLDKHIQDNGQERHQQMLTFHNPDRLKQNGSSHFMYAYSRTHMLLIRGHTSKPDKGMDIMKKITWWCMRFIPSGRMHARSPIRDASALQITVHTGNTKSETEPFFLLITSNNSKEYDHWHTSNGTRNKFMSYASNSIAHVKVYTNANTQIHTVYA